MRFRLHYRGPLHSNADAARKQAIRRHFHPQLGALWDSPGLDMWRTHDWGYQEDPGRWFRDRGLFRFVPLVNRKLSNIAALHITWLRPGDLGGVVTSSGDIDNRLKTLFDALRVPDPAQVPAGDVPGDSERPFYCLLDDDALVTEVDIVTDRLLEPGVETNHVELIIAVAVRNAHEAFGQVTLVQA